MFIIYLIAAVHCGMTLIRESLPNETEQFHITISGIIKTGKCYMSLIVIQEDFDFVVPVTDSFTLTFTSTVGSYTVSQMNQYKTMLEFVSCPSSVDFIIGPYEILHLQANAFVQIKFTTSTSQYFQYPLIYYQDKSTDVRIATNSKFTSDQNLQLTLNYTPISALTGQQVVNLILPYRDEFATNPTSHYFPTSLMECDIYIKNVLVSGISCYFRSNVITVPSLTGSDTITFIFYNFINPQSATPVTSIEFQLTQFFTSKSFIIESLQGLVLQATTPSQIIYPGIFLSDNHIGNSCDVKFVLQYTDFLYLGTTMSITFPDNFFVSPFTITMNSDLRQDFTSSTTGSTLVIDNFILTDGQQQLLQFAVSTSNPQVMKNYDGLIIKFSQNGDQIAYSDFQKLVLQPQIFKSFTMANSNKKVRESTEYCFTFELNHPIDTNSFIEINFFTPVTFDIQVSLVKIQNLNPGALLQRNGQVITITNVFSTTQFNQPMSFCLTGVFNPYYIDTAFSNYDFSIQLNDFKQVVNLNSQFIDLQAGELNVMSVDQSVDVTNSQSNTVTIIITSHSGFAQGDFIIVTFDNSQYDLDIAYLSNNLLSCQVQSQNSSCKIYDNKIQITSSILIQPGTEITILIQNFITNRSLNNINPISIITQHSLFLIDQSNQPSYLSVSQPNKLQKFAVSINDQGGLVIQIKFIYNLLSTDVTYIDIPLTFDCVDCQCISDNCYLANNIITIRQVALSNKLQTFTIINQPPEIIPNLGVRAVDQQGFMIYQDKTYEVQRVYQFEQFELTPQNTTIGLLTTYKLSFAPYIQINALDIVELALHNDYAIQSLTCDNVKCTFNNTKIQFQFNAPILPHEMISLKLQAITNPMSKITHYYYSLSHSQQSVVIQQSVIKSQQFTCLFDNCQQCQTSYCQKCMSPYFEVEGNCLLSCPKNYVIIDDSCKQCQAGIHCSLCSTLNLQRCVECISGYNIIDGQCIRFDFYNITTTENTSNTSIPNNTTTSTAEQTTEMKKVQHQIGLLNYLQFGVFASLVLYKLIRKETQLFFTFSIFLGFSIPIFRIFSFINFINDNLLIYASYSLMLIGMSAFQSISFQFKVETPLYLDSDYNNQLKKKNNLLLLNLLFQYMDFRIMCCLRSQLHKSNIYNYRFENHDYIRTAVYNNYKKLITIINPCNFAFLLTAVLITQSNNYQFEFLIYTSVEWLANLIAIRSQF